MVAETATGARRLHFSAQASASVRENVPADSLIYSNIKVPRHDPWEFVKLPRVQDVLIE